MCDFFGGRVFKLASLTDCWLNFYTPSVSLLLNCHRRNCSLQLYLHLYFVVFRVALSVKVNRNKYCFVSAVIEDFIFLLK